jgi:hypothetical protein
MNNVKPLHSVPSRERTLSTADHARPAASNDDTIRTTFPDVKSSMQNFDIFRLRRSRQPTPSATGMPLQWLVDRLKMGHRHNLATRFYQMKKWCYINTQHAFMAKLSNVRSETSTRY